MIVSINSGDLQELLSRGGLAAMTDPIKSSPYRGFGRLSLQGSKLTIQSEGSTVASMSFSYVDGEDNEDGACVFSIDNLLKIIKYIPKKSVIRMEYRRTEEDIVGTIVVKTKGSKTEMGCAHPNLYMMLAGPCGDPVTTIDGDSLFSKIDKVSFAADANDADGMRSNICIRSNGGVVHVAAARREMLCYSTVGDGNMDADIYIPISVIPSIKKFFTSGNVSFYDSGKNIFIEQERGWVRFCKQNVSGFPNFTSFDGIATTGKVRMAMDRFVDVVGACIQANEIEAAIVVREGKVYMAAVGSDNGMKHTGSISVSDDSDDISVQFTVSPFMLASFFKKNKSLSSILSMEVSNGGNVSYMKLTVDSVKFFVKERKTLTTNPMGEINV